MLTREEKQYLKLANDYENQLQNVLHYFKIPDPLCDDRVIADLSSDETVAPFITGTITGKYPNTMILNGIVKAASFYYVLMRSNTAQQKELKEGYLTARKELEKACNVMSFKDTYYSIEWRNHANGVLTKSVVIDIISRYYKGRFINNQTGKVVQRYDNHGTRMKKEIVLACLEKYQR